ncbi:MAG: trigger factor [Thermotogota bacterium]|nr:trigger factor [Thermotogota bacterium]
MDKKVIETDKNVEVVKFLFDKEESKKAEDKVVSKVNMNYQIPGFRKGRVPKNIVINFIGDNYEDLVLDELSDKLEEALKEESDELYVPAVISERKLEDNYAAFTIELHRDPKSTVKDYTNIELKVPRKQEIVMNYIDSKLEELRDEHSIMEPKEGKLAIGDIAEIEYSIVKDEKKLADNKKQEIEIDENDERPIVKNIIGKSKGETVEFEKTFEGSDNKYYYTINIVETYRKTLMELGDELAKTVNYDVNDLEELKAKLKEEGTEQYENWKYDFLRQQVSSLITDYVDIEISDRTLDYFVSRAIENSKKEGSYEKYLKKVENEEELKKEFKRNILNELKKERAVEKISENEKIEVTNEEIENKIKELAPYWGISEEQALGVIKERKRMKDELEENIRRTKVFDAVIAKADVKEVDENEEENQEEEKSEEKDEQENNEDKKE